MVDSSCGTVDDNEAMLVQLGTLIRWSSKSEVSRSTGIDRSNIRDIMQGRRGIGPVTRERICHAYHHAVEARYGVGVIRFPKNVQKWLDEIKAVERISDPGSRKAALRNLYFNDKIGMTKDEVFNAAGEDQYATVYRASLNIINANINRRAANVLTMATEYSSRLQAPIKSVRQYAAAADLFQCAMSQPYQDSGWSVGELQALIGYSRINQLGVLSDFRHERRKINSGFSVFSDEQIADELALHAAEMKTLLPFYRLGHPDRLIVASNSLVIASLTHDRDMALASWEALVEEYAPGRDLRNTLPTHDRPLAESSQCKWIVDNFGFTL